MPVTDDVLVLVGLVDGVVELVLEKDGEGYGDARHSVSIAKPLVDGAVMLKEPGMR